MVKHLAQSQGKKPLPQLPNGEFSIISASHFQIATFQYDTTVTTGCSNTSAQHKNLPPTLPAPASSLVTLPFAAHVMPLLQVGSVILFGMESMINVLTENKVAFDAAPLSSNSMRNKGRIEQWLSYVKKIGDKFEIRSGESDTDRYCQFTGGGTHLYYAQELRCSDLCTTRQ